MLSKNNSLISPEVELEAAKIFGKHVSKKKALLLFIVTSVVCLLPIVLGIKFFDQIPKVIITGIIGTDGKDDSMPRSVLVFGIPALMFILNGICHGQFYVHQLKNKMPPKQVRFFGRWGWSIISTILCSTFILRAAKMPCEVIFYIKLVISLIVLIYASNIYDTDKKKDIISYLLFALGIFALIINYL